MCSDGQFSWMPVCSKGCFFKKNKTKPLLSSTEIKPGKGVVLRSESLCLFIPCHYCGRVLPRGYDCHREVLWKEFMIKKTWRVVLSLEYILCEDTVVCNIWTLWSMTRSSLDSAVRLARSFTFVFFTAPQKLQMQHLALAHHFSVSEISKKRGSFREVQGWIRQRIYRDLFVQIEQRQSRVSVRS